jgi:hypothetical protein
MLFTICGVDEQTGRKREALIDAPSEPDAVQRAAELGVIVPGAEAIAEEVRRTAAAARHAELSRGRPNCTRCGAPVAVGELRTSSRDSARGAIGVVRGLLSGALPLPGGAVSGSNVVCFHDADGPVFGVAAHRCTGCGLIEFYVR